MKVSKAPDYQYEVFKSMHQIIHDHCKRHTIPTAEGDKLFRELQQEAFDNKHELLMEVPSACQRLWTSAKTLRGQEFCSILNESIRDDVASCMTDVAVICRGINSLCVMDRSGGGTTTTVNSSGSSSNSSNVQSLSRGVEWPADHTLYRGGSLPDDKRSFFVSGVTYRCPMYLATSVNRILCLGTFCRRASMQGMPPVLWVLHLNSEVCVCD